MDDSLDAWIARQTAASRARMRAAISRTDLIHPRRGFGFEVRPKPGSVLACPLSAHYDPDPDYFFHWFRDAAAVMEALRVDAEATGESAGVRALFSDFVRFNAGLAGIDGRATALPQDVDPAFRRYLRPRAEIDAVDGRTAVLEARVEADGTLDVTRWNRPQWDGPALRVLTFSRWWDTADPSDRPAMRGLIEADLTLLAGGFAAESFDIWEEEFGHHLYTDLVIAAALREGTARLDDKAFAVRCVAAAETVETRLPAYRTPDGWLRSRLPGPGISGEKALDMATVVAVLHAGRTTGPVSLIDPSVLGTLARLEDLFAANYAINRAGPGAIAPAMGRYPGDVYVSGGAFHFSTFAAAEFHFRLAVAITEGATLEVTAANRRFLGTLPGPEIATRQGDGAYDGDAADLAAACVRRGEAFLETTRAFAPADGALAEQFDRTDGRPASAKDLAWSHAACLTAVAWRTRARSISPG